jgi:membrane-associated phospholipid phosphatase
MEPRRHRTVVALVAALLSLSGSVLPAQVLQEPPPTPQEPPPAPEPDQPETSPTAPTAPPETEPEPEKQKGPKEPIVVRDHRTVRGYPANLGHNVVEVWRKPSLLPLLVGTGATLLSAPLDDGVVRFFERNPAKGWGDTGRVIGSSVVAAGASTALFGIGRYANGDRFKAATYDTSQAVVVNFFYTFVLKEAIKRRRPDGSDRLSFPSGHASNAFAVATVWVEQYGWKAAVPGYLAASFVAGSRLALAKHHLSDIVGGATLGYIVGRSVARWDKKPSSKPVHGAPNAILMPYGGPDGSGLGLAVEVQF